MKYYVKLYTYAGTCPGAVHHWAVIKAYDLVDSRDPDRYDSLSKKYKSRDEALRDALNWFKRERRNGDILFLGSAGICDPQEVLRGPRLMKKKANALVRQADAIGGWDGDEKKMKLICTAWDKLWAKSEPKESRR